jgi:hypothetical protein
MSRPGRFVGSRRLCADGVWLKAPQKRLAAGLESRDEWCGCDMRWSIVRVEAVIPRQAAAASWAVERGGERGGALRRCCDRKPVEWDAKSNFTACNKRGRPDCEEAGDERRATTRHGIPKGRRENACIR